MRFRVGGGFGRGEEGGLTDLALDWEVVAGGEETHGVNQEDEGEGEAQDQGVHIML